MATNPFAEWTKMFGEFKTPVMDVNHLISLYRRDAETGTTVIQIATETAQAMGKRNVEILKSNAEHMLKASKELTSNTSPESVASKQADFAKTLLDYNINSIRELMEMGTKSAQEAFDVINKRAAEKMKEFSDVASSAAHHGTSSKKKAA